ncbi:uncharacterized protein LOC133746080 [Rosa rugosa]|uniref:uncharacterized protein LOC133746080 n=1 Tax=Rosa rugosa TaxID=74645 RepID=UPI002B405DAC|nr:uncharacterized protein LOC133746080 [Rosa rugosa]
MSDGYSSNIASRVSLEDNKILNLKSHDCHVLIQQLLSVALRGLLPKGPRVSIFRLCASLNLLCQRVIDINKVELLDKELPETLCMLERFFPPSFFDVMVHLTIHLAQQVLIAGPVLFCWMFHFERYMKVLKDYVKNRSNLEGCIAEKYLAEEITRFCDGYIKEAAEICVQHKRNEDCEDEIILEGKPIGLKKLRQLTPTMWEIAHRYVLTNTTELDPWKELHKDELKLVDKRLEKNTSLLQMKHQRTFSDWLADKVRTSDCSTMSDTVRWITCKPKREVLSCSGYLINWNRFHTRESEKGTQNCGVSVEADTYCRASARDTMLKLDKVDYYGVIKEIILLDYRKFKVPMFDCDWANIVNGVKVEEGFTLVNLRIGQHQFQRDPFIFASQANQVFYSRESDVSNWSVVLRAPPRGLYDNENPGETDYMPSVPLDLSELSLNFVDEDLRRNHCDVMSEASTDSESGDGESTEL